jgi:transcriptional regulator with XRE-family HTH domain
VPSAGKNPRSLVAQTIEGLMQSRGLTVDRVATESGIGRDRIDALLRCEREATVEDLIRLAGVFDVEPGRFIEELD